MSAKTRKHPCLRGHQAHQAIKGGEFARFLRAACSMQPSRFSQYTWEWANCLTTSILILNSCFLGSRRIVIWSLGTNEPQGCRKHHMTQRIYVTPPRSGSTAALLLVQSSSMSTSNKSVVLRPAGSGTHSYTWFHWSVHQQPIDIYFHRLNVSDQDERLRKGDWRWC
jgi:hypothetical protein